MSEAEGGAKEKKTGGAAAIIAVVTTIVTVITVVNTVGKDAYDRYVSGKDKSVERRAKRRETLSRVSHLGFVMGDLHAYLLAKERLAPPTPEILQARAAGNAVLAEMKIAGRELKANDALEFAAYDKELNLTLRDGYGETAWSLYQLQELGEETCAALQIGKQDGRSAWLKAWSPNWKNYRAWMSADLGKLGLTFDLPASIDPTDPQPTIDRVRELQGLVQRSIDGDRIAAES